MSADYRSVVVRYQLFPELDFYLSYADLNDSSMPVGVVGTLTRRGRQNRRRSGAAPRASLFLPS